MKIWQKVLLVCCPDILLSRSVKKYEFIRDRIMVHDVAKLEKI